MASTQRKAVIIGTSNALMRDGWVNQTRKLAEDAGWAYSNKSIGGSSSFLGAYLLATDPEVRKADRVIIDFFINDQLFIAAGQATLHHVLGHYASMLISLKEMKALDRVLVLMFPQQEVDNDLFDTMCILFEKTCVRYIDFRTQISDWSRAQPRGYGTAYSDPFHFSSDFQHHICEVVLEEIGRNRQLRRRNFAFRSAILRSQPLGIAPFDIRSDANDLCNRGTSELQHPVIRFRNGDQFHISGPPLFVGAHIWATQDAGVVTIRGVEDGFRVHLRRDYKGIFIFDSVFEPVAVPMLARVDVLNDKSVPFQRMRGQHSSIYDATGSTVEIVALVGAEHAPAQLGKAVLDLLESSPKSIWDSIISLIRRVVGSR